MLRSTQMYSHLHHTHYKKKSQKNKLIQTSMNGNIDLNDVHRLQILPHQLHMNLPSIGVPSC